LSKITGDIAGNFNIDAQLLPMTNDPAATFILTSAGHLNFQDYFVRMKCKPVIKQVIYDEASVATPNPDVLTALNQAELRAIILCPSNPFLSMDPILAVPGIREAMVTSPAPVIGVSPIINDQAIKGPTSKIMSELSLPSSVQAIAEHYGDLLDGFVIDTADQDQSNEINTSVMNSNILMNSLKDRENLALEVLAFADAITTKENGSHQLRQYDVPK
jgi:LPPG:FO 2-phospho-L-lactate transferase